MGAGFGAAFLGHFFPLEERSDPPIGGKGGFKFGKAVARAQARATGFKTHRKR
jgi:hypothetical protein